MPRAKKAKSPSKRGRPSKFDGLDLALVERLYKEGLTDKQVAKILCLTEQTINNFKKARPDFFESIKSWKDEADGEVERSLLESAKGYTHDHEEIFCYKGQIIRAKTKKYYPPNAISLIFWLTNRQADKWRRNQERDLSNAEISEILEDLAKRRAKGRDS